MLNFKILFFINLDEKKLKKWWDLLFLKIICNKTEAITHSEIWRFSWVLAKRAALEKGLDFIRTYKHYSAWFFKEFIIKDMDFWGLKVIGIELIDRQFGLWSNGRKFFGLIPPNLLSNYLKLMELAVKVIPAI